MMHMRIGKCVFPLLLASSAQALAQFDELMGACAVIREDLILSEHIMSLHSGRVPPQTRDYIRSEVIRIKRNVIRRENPLLTQKEVEEETVQWLEHQLDELENQDQEDFTEDEI